MALQPWFPQRSTADHGVAVLKNLIFHANVPLTHTSIEREVTAQLEYPHFTLQTFKQILSRWNIESIPIQIKSRDLTKLHLPAIACLDREVNPFVVVCEVSEQKVRYIHPLQGWIEEPMEEFNKAWNGQILLSLPIEGAGEKDYQEKRMQEHVRRNLDPTLNKVRRIPDFISGTDCEHLIDLASSLFHPSKVVNAMQASLHRGRNSHSASLKMSRDQVLNSLYQKASSLLDIPIDYFEYAQCVSYSKGQEYQAHFDCLDESTPLGKEKIALYGQRALTILIYLNDNFEGGETFFPALDLKITPTRGTALLFHSLNKDSSLDKDSLHAGLPVFSGTKYALNLWVWTKPIRKIMQSMDDKLIQHI